MSTDKQNKDKSLGPTYERLRTSLMRYTSRYFRKTHEIEDVVQEAFVKVLEAQGDRTIRSIDAYLFRTARNIALNTIGKCDYKLTETLGDLILETDIAPSSTLEDQKDMLIHLCRKASFIRDMPKGCYASDYAAR